MENMTSQASSNRTSHFEKNIGQFPLGSYFKEGNYFWEVNTVRHQRFSAGDSDQYLLGTRITWDDEQSHTQYDMLVGPLQPVEPLTEKDFYALKQKVEERYYSKCDLVDYNWKLICGTADALKAIVNVGTEIAAKVNRGDFSPYYFIYFYGYKGLKGEPDCRKWRVYKVFDFQQDGTSLIYKYVMHHVALDRGKERTTGGEFFAYLSEDEGTINTKYGAHDPFSTFGSSHGCYRISSDLYEQLRRLK